ncbi:MAG: hypothetical protein KDA75_14475 [Planctomycetaceae bacterium]|nr:hypothetical protein [Planctomycetaceae bacterium]
MRTLLLPLLTLCLTVASSLAADSVQTVAAVELQNGERVALIGGTLIEREQRYGYWEHAMTSAYPDRNITFRNLGWAGDTVWADSRGIFDPADKGYARLIEQVQQLRPTLFVLNYGGNEAWESLQRGEPADAAIERFIAQYAKLIGDLTAASSGKPEDAAPPAGDAAGSPPRFLLLTPLPMEQGVGPNSEPSRYNEHLAKYAAAIQILSRDRGFPCVDLADLHRWYAGEAAGEQTQRPLTGNGLHLSEYGYWRTAPWVRERLCGGTTAPALHLPSDPNTLGESATLDPQSGRIRVLAPRQPDLKQDQVCREVEGQYSSLPVPAPDEHAGEGRQLSFDLTVAGMYRLNVDDEPAARGTPAEWKQGRRLSVDPDLAQSRALLTAIRRKNELYFHRWRPQNVTYLFLFRKHEQGNNAVEIPQFDPLVAAEEARIADLRQPQRHIYKLIREAGN